MPEISIIVPVYNVEKYLPRCVDSILGQTFTNFDLILIDDGSPDNCLAICEEYATKDSRVHVIHQENGGLSAARNAGIDYSFANSNSEWITFIDSDDWVHHDYLKTLFALAHNYDVKISMCGYIKRDTFCFDGPLNDSPTLLLNSEQAYIDYYSFCMPAYCKLYRKSLLSELRFPIGKLHEDAFITHLLIFMAENVAISEEKLYCYFTNPESITHAQWTEKRLDEIEAHENRLTFLYDNNYADAYKREIQAYLYSLFYQIKSLQSISDLFPYHFRMLTKKFRKNVLHFHRTGIIGFHNYIHFFEAAFPRIMKIYWYVQAALTKLHLKE
ncbi:MAG: glycosyltransferase family 2 protein [Candidatus Limivicinus sp.]|nr:glycosyltransferase family 2 protein [Candidatus Limivicinus sp.]